MSDENLEILPAGGEPSRHQEGGEVLSAGPGGGGGAVQVNREEGTYEDTEK